MSLNTSLSDCCCSVLMLQVRIPSRENQKLLVQKSYSKTVGFYFQMYIFRTSKMCTITPQNNNNNKKKNAMKTLTSVSDKRNRYFA